MKINVMETKVMILERENSMIDLNIAIEDERAEQVREFE